MDTPNPSGRNRTSKGCKHPRRGNKPKYIFFHSRGKERKKSAREDAFFNAQCAFYNAQLSYLCTLCVIGLVTTEDEEVTIFDDLIGDW